MTSRKASFYAAASSPAFVIVARLPQCSIIPTTKHLRKYVCGRRLMLCRMRRVQAHYAGVFAQRAGETEAIVAKF